ncbi:MAG: NADPH-dependent assimilatory sulfite reductase hemoprotein subunit [Gemmatimonadota bacterium]
MSVTPEVELSEVEKIKEESRGLRGPLDEELENDATHFSDEAKTVLKFHGSYEQDDRDQRRARKRAGLEPAYSFMTRSRIPGGVLTAEQYLAHDDLATRYANGTLRVTTRQTIQLHGVLKGDLRRTIRSLNDALVSTLATCGDVNRNVLSCAAPLPDRLRAEALDVARSISDHLLPKTRAYHEIWIDGELTAGGEPEPDPIYENRYLPRKFKTAIAFPEDNCTDIYSNDLGFLVIHDHDRLIGFNVLVGGGFGQTHGKEDTYPRLADPLAFVTRDQVLDVATAVVLTQRDFGNRENRKRARLKYLIDERGLEWFRSEVEERLGWTLTQPAPVQVTGSHDHLGWHEQGSGEWFYGVFVENGRIQEEPRAVLRRIVEQFRFGVRLTPQQNLLLTDIPEKRRAEVERMLNDHGVRDLTSISTVRRFAMACPALPTCPLALAESERALPGIVDELEIELNALGIADVPLTVRMTGCPNGCARPYTADLAFVGRSLDKYVVYVGGNLEGTRLNVSYADLVPRAQLVATVRPLLERFARERAADERLGDFWHRVGLPS